MPCRSGSPSARAWSPRPPSAWLPARAWQLTGWFRSSHDGPHPLAVKDTQDGAGLLDVEDHDRKPIGLAEPERVGVHDGVLLDQGFLECELGNEGRRRILLRIAGVDAVDVGRLEDHFGVDLEGTKHRG